MPYLTELLHSIPLDRALHLSLQFICSGANPQAQSALFKQPWQELVNIASQPKPIVHSHQQVRCHGLLNLSSYKA